MESDPDHFKRFTMTMDNFFNFFNFRKREIGGSSKGEGEGRGGGGGGGGGGGSSAGRVVDGGGSSAGGVADGGAGVVDGGAGGGGSGGGGRDGVEGGELPDNLDKEIQQLVREEMTANWDRLIHCWYGYFVQIVPLLAFISRIESRTLLRELNHFGIGVLATTIGAIIIRLQSRLNRR